MYALIWRDLVTIMRAGAYWAALAVYVSMLTAFVVLWGDGMPLPNGGSNWDQFGALQWVALLLVLPWLTARCHVTAPEELTRLALTVGSTPSRVVLARCIANVAALTMFIGCSMPLVAVMRQAAALPIGEAARGVLPFGALVVFVATMTTGAILLCGHRLGGWLIATIGTAVTAFALAGESPVWWLVIAAAAAGPLLLWTDARLSYLPGGR